MCWSAVKNLLTHTHRCRDTWSKLLNKRIAARTDLDWAIITLGCLAFRLSADSVDQEIYLTQSNLVIIFLLWEIFYFFVPLYIILSYRCCNSISYSRTLWAHGVATFLEHRAALLEHTEQLLSQSTQNCWGCLCSLFLFITVLDLESARSLFFLAIRCELVHSLFTLVGIFVRLARQRWSLHAPLVLPLATVRSHRLPHLSGTVCRSQFGDRQHCQFSVIDWIPKASFLLGPSVRDVSTALTLLRDTSYCNVSLQFLGLYDTIVIRPSSSSSMVGYLITWVYCVIWS